MSTNDHKNELTMLKNMNFFLSMVTIPATMGANVLKMGKKRAKIMALPPYFSKKSLDCTKYFFLNQKVSSFLNR